MGGVGPCLFGRGYLHSEAMLRAGVYLIYESRPDFGFKLKTFRTTNRHIVNSFHATTMTKKRIIPLSQRLVPHSRASPIEVT